VCSTVARPNPTYNPTEQIICRPYVQTATRDYLRKDQRLMRGCLRSETAAFYPIKLYTFNYYNSECMKPRRSGIGAVVVALVAIVVVLAGALAFVTIMPRSSNQPTTTTDTSTATQSGQYSHYLTNSSNVNLTSFILLNNLAMSSHSYKIYNALEIESSGNSSFASIMIWSTNHTSSITINSTTAYIQTDYNSCIMRNYGNLIQWPVSSIYNTTNYPFPVTVYAGYTSYNPSVWGIAGTPKVPSQNYFVVGYVSDGIPYIVYNSQVNTTRSIVISSQPTFNGTCA
jgi:FlaG/FlaF family flagellin (archaellin)